METDAIKRERKPTKKWSAQEKLAFCQAWESSGLSRSEYARREGLSASVLCFWLKKRTGAQGAPIKFVGAPLRLEQANEEQCLEVKLPNGLQCRFPRVINIKQICQIIEELERCHY
jgi:transposase-like protein